MAWAETFPLVGHLLLRETFPLVGADGTYGRVLFCCGRVSRALHNRLWYCTVVGRVSSSFFGGPYGTYTKTRRP